MGRTRREFRVGARFPGHQAGYPSQGTVSRSARLGGHGAGPHGGPADTCRRPAYVPIDNGGTAGFVSSRAGDYQESPVYGPLLDQMWVR